MNKKTLTLIIASIFLIGIVIAGVGADREISNTDGIYIDDFIAGTEVQANFSYYYIRDMPDNPDNSSLILKISINSSDEDYPVWKNDFSISGYIERWNFIPWLVREIPFNCFEDITEVVHPLGDTTIEPQNGTFYCFDPEGEMDFADFNTRDIVFLNILSHPALYPGQYNLSAEFYYPQEEYINVDVTPIINRVRYGENTTVEFNMSFEISGGNAIRMKMSDLFEGYYYSDGITFIIDGANYTVEELNARLVYNETNYSVGNDYNYSQPPIVFSTDSDGIARGSAIFMMDIKDYMEPGTYHGTYQFNVTQEEP